MQIVDLFNLETTALEYFLFSLYTAHEGGMFDVELMEHLQAGDGPAGRSHVRFPPAFYRPGGPGHGCVDPTARFACLGRKRSGRKNSQSFQCRVSDIRFDVPPTLKEENHGWVLKDTPTR